MRLVRPVTLIPHLIRSDYILLDCDKRICLRCSEKTFCKMIGTRICKGKKKKTKKKKKNGKKGQNKAFLFFILLHVNSTFKSADQIDIIFNIGVSS